VNTILGKEKRGRDAVDWRVAPSLVVKAARGLEMVEVGLVGLAAPEVHIRNLEVAPDCKGAAVMSARNRREQKATDSDKDCTTGRHYWTQNPWRCSGRQSEDLPG
jgi:hypothetical protein